MSTFAKIQAMAAKRKGGKANLKKLMPPILSNTELAKKGDDRFLATICKCINQAGFSWKVIEKKWPEFEEAFFGFDVRKLLSLTPEDWEAYCNDPRVVRNGQKIMALKHNVLFVDDIAREHGSFAKFIANWPETDQAGLLIYLKKHGSRLGGQTAQWFLRYVGKDCFILTPDVCKAIQNAGVDIADNPTTQRDLKLAQATFNSWHEESGLPFAHISKVAAYSIGENYDNNMIQANMEKLEDTM